MLIDVLLASVNLVPNDFQITYSLATTKYEIVNMYPTVYLIQLDPPPRFTVPLSKISV